MWTRRKDTEKREYWKVGLDWNSILRKRKLGGIGCDFFLKDEVRVHNLQFAFQCPVRPYVLPFLQSSVPLIVGQIQM